MGSAGLWHNVKPVTIDVCVATFRRPILLKTLLTSLLQLRVAGHISIRIIVVDNDRDESAREIVDFFRATTEIPLVYAVEPVQNIALARNRGVAMATGELVAFLDDDEYPDENWLQNLVDAMVEYMADAVFGPVVPILPSTAPTWIIEGRFFDRPRFPNGESVEIGATSNALVKREILLKWGKPFDIAYGLTGGEDAEFFKRMKNAGHLLIWCDSAIVNEAVPKSRLSVRYLAVRAFTSGQTYASLERRRGAMALAQWLVRRIALLAVSVIFMLVALPLGRKFSVRALQKFLSNLGQLSSVMKYRYKRYVVRPS